LVKSAVSWSQYGFIGRLWRAFIVVFAGESTIWPPPVSARGGSGLTPGLPPAEEICSTRRLFFGNGPGLASAAAAL